MGSNYADEICNCKKECSCPKGYSCCSEEVPDGKKATFGLCCKNGTCTSGGHCKEVKSAKNTKENWEQSNYIFGQSIESYSDNSSSNWINIYIIIVVCLGCLLILKGK